MYPPVDGDAFIIMCTSPTPVRHWHCLRMNQARSEEEEKKETEKTRGQEAKRLMERKAAQKIKTYSYEKLQKGQYMTGMHNQMRHAYLTMNTFRVAMDVSIVNSLHAQTTNCFQNCEH